MTNPFRYGSSAISDPHRVRRQRNGWPDTILVILMTAAGLGSLVFIYWTLTLTVIK